MVNFPVWTLVITFKDSSHKPLTVSIDQVTRSHVMEAWRKEHPSMVIDTSNDDGDILLTRADVLHLNMRPKGDS